MNNISNIVKGFATKSEAPRFELKSIEEDLFLYRDKHILRDGKQWFVETNQYRVNYQSIDRCMMAINHYYNRLEKDGLI